MELTTDLGRIVWQLFLLIVLGGVNHQIAHIITVGVVFEDVRVWVARHLGAKLAYLVRCHLCAGTWIGFGQGWAMWQEIEVSPDPLWNGVFVAFFTSMLGRVFNEVLALMALFVVAMRAIGERDRPCK